MIERVTSANVRAFLRVIREGESDQTEDAYTVMFGGDHFYGFRDHPRMKNTALVKGKVYTSTAAGAYQIIVRTWDGIRKELGLSDFSPVNQDRAAIGLIAQHGALQDVIDGRIHDAIQKCEDEWASLPGSPAGQPTQALSHALAVYAKFGGKLSQGGPSP